MSNWSIYNANAEQLTAGLQGPEVCDEAKIAAQRLANDRGESVWIGPDDAEWGDLTEVEPDSE